MRFRALSHIITQAIWTLYIHSVYFLNSLGSIQQVLPFSATSLATTSTRTVLAWYPFTPGWSEAVWISVFAHRTLQHSPRFELGSSDRGPRVLYTRPHCSTQYSLLIPYN